MTERSKTIASWERRAGAYRDLTERWPLFSTVAGRLLDELPEDLSGTVIDLGAGAGLLSALVLERFPSTKVVLVEPASAMLTLAEARLGSGIAAVHNAPAEDVGDLAVRGDACVANAAAHLFDEERVLAGLRRVLLPGAVYAFNLWGHSFETTADAIAVDWRGEIEAVFAEAGLPRPVWSAPATPRIRKRVDLERLADENGFELIGCHSDVDDVSTTFNLDFALMAPEWLAVVPENRRAEIVQRARERLAAPEPVHSTRIVLVRSRA